MFVFTCFTNMKMCLQHFVCVTKVDKTTFINFCKVLQHIYIYIDIYMCIEKYKKKHNSFLLNLVRAGR